jgi:hypothetical protein
MPKMIHGPYVGIKLIKASDKEVCSIFEKEGRSPLSQLSPSSAALPMLRSDAISEMMASTMTTAPYT